MPDKEEMNFQFPTMSRGMKKLITGYLVIFVLLIGTVSALQLMQKAGVGDLQRKASTSGIDLTLTPSKTSVAAGEQFTVTVFADPKGKSMTAADLTINFDATRFTAVSFTKGTMFDTAATGYGGNQATTLLYDQTTSNGVVNNTAGTARIAVGAVCDKCYLGTAPTPPIAGVVACGTSPAPKCYPKTTTGQLAVLTLQAKTGVSGAGAISFDATLSQTAELNSDTDATVDRIATSVTIAGTTPSATPTGNGSLCNIDLVAPFGTINLADYGNFKTKYIAYLQNSTYDASIDFTTPTGTINLADYGVFKTKYITYLQNSTCN
jgi:hypothetical protein